MTTSARSTRSARPWLAVNAGSSSLKLALLDERGHRVFAGVVDGIGSETVTASDLRRTEPVALQIDQHEQALDWLLDQLLRTEPAAASDWPPVAVGHRVVHGGERYDQATRIDADTLETLTELGQLAPLHNPIALRCIHRARQRLPDSPHFALFDTAFHHDLPPQSRWYALPRFCRDELGIRRFGFHGLSVAHALRSLAERLGRPASQLNLIVAHLGNGASMTAIRQGHSFDTSMGFTPLEGLVMGSRAGDLDPALPEYIEQHSDRDAAAVERMLNQESGLLGLCGYRDLRDIHTARARGDRDAQQAFELYVHRIRRYLGGYVFTLGSVDAVVFTGGIGEHDAQTRAAVCAGLEAFGIVLDPDANAGSLCGHDRHGPARCSYPIHHRSSPTGIWVLPADEEREMVQQMREQMSTPD